MDWQLERERQEKIRASNKTGGDKSINMMVAMEREFVQIFGAGSNAAFSGRRGKTGDHAGDYASRSELSHDNKHSSE
jgi:hypothetical protein